MTAAEPGQAAYEARFAHARPRDVEPWDSLTPEVKAIWARVEAASLVGGAVYTGDTRQLHADLLMAADELARMAAHAKTLGPKGAVWVESPDLLIALYRNAAVALATADRDSSEYADAMNARMEDAAHMETLRLAVLVLAECKIGSGLAAVRKWFADGMRGPIPWPDDTLFASWAAGHEIFDCNGAMGFRRGDRGRAA